MTDGIEHTPANDAPNPTGRRLSDDGPAATAVDEPQNDDRRSADEDGTSESGVGESEQSSDNLLETEGEIAADYLEELLDVADLDGDIDTYVENDRAQVSLITESGQLIGSEGEVLEALQELTRLAVTNQTGERSRLMLDIGGFRQDRRRKLTELATDVIDEVKTSGESVRLDPMNPFERKIVHDAVAAAGLTSESDGVEPERRVVVRPSE